MGNQYKHIASGETVTLEGADALTGVQSGAFEPLDGRVPVVTPRGAYGSVAAKQLLGNDDGLTAPNPLASRAAGAEAETAGRFNSFEHTSQAFGEGILSGLTFGGTDAFGLNPDSAEVAAARPGTRLAGSIIGNLALPVSGAAIGARLAPSGTRGAQLLLGGMAEGGGFGVGTGISNLVLRDEPLTAESAFIEIGTQTLFGLGAGAVGGVAGHGLETAGAALKGYGTRSLGKLAEAEALGGSLGSTARGVHAADGIATAMKGLDDVVEKASVEVEHSVANHRWYETPEHSKPAREVLEFDGELDKAHLDVVAGLRKRADAIEASTTAPSALVEGPSPAHVERLIKWHAEAPVPSETMVRSFRLSRQWLDESIQHVEGLSALGSLKNAGEAKAMVGRAKKLRGELAHLSAGTTEKVAGQSPSGTKQIVAKTKEYQELTTQLEAMRTTGVIDEKVLAAEERRNALLAELKALDGTPENSGAIADALGRPKLASRGGNKSLKDMSVDERRGIATKLVEYRNLGREMEQKFGGPGLGIAEPADEVLALERFAAGKNPYIDRADEVYSAAREGDIGAVRELIRSGKLDPGLVGKLDLDNIEKSVASWEAKTAANAEHLAKAKALRVAADDLGVPSSLGPDGLEKLGKQGSWATGSEVAGNVSERTAKLAANASELGDTALTARIDKLSSRADSVADNIRNLAGKAPHTPNIVELRLLQQAKNARTIIGAQLGDGITVEALIALPHAQVGPVLSALNEYYIAVKELGKTSSAFAQAHREVEQVLKRAARGNGNVSSSGRDMLLAFGAIQATTPDFDGPVDDLAKLWVASTVARGRGTTSGSMRSSIQNWLRGSARLAGRRSFGGPGLVGATKGVAGQNIAGWAVNGVLGSASGLARTTAKAVARGEQIVGKLIQGTGRAVRKAAPFSPRAYLEAVKFADLDHPEGTSAFDARAREIRTNVAYSLGLQQAVNSNLGDVALHHPGVADKIVAQADRTMRFLASKLPRDPGTITRLGRSEFKPSEQGIAKFTRFARAAQDPLAELDRFADGSLSVEGAEAIRVLYPALFANFQRAVLSRLPELQTKLSYEHQVQMSILFNIPVTSLMRPEVVQQVQRTFALDAGPNGPISQPSNATGGVPTPLSPAQEILAR